VTERLLLIGNFESFHVGAHFKNGASTLGLQTECLDIARAYSAPALIRKFNWWCRGRRPTRLHSFAAEVVENCRRFQPHCILTTGIAPLPAAALQMLKTLGIRCVNYLTDDPWNPAHRAPWFMEALPEYHHVFSTRRANLDDLRRHGCRHVHYLPFAYAPEIHFRELPPPQEREKFRADVVFAGGADQDRLPCFHALISAGLDVALYGGYWEKNSTTRRFARGHAHGRTLRNAISGANIALCLVRRANRDGHAMRSFEVPAMGGCMLLEDTAEHREIFGDDGENAAYFADIPAMINKAKWLLAHHEHRHQLAQAAHARITSGAHTYRDRLKTILDVALTRP
jgi:spore maturation protein CgeB